MERDMAVCMLQAVRDLRDGKVEPQPQAAADGRQYYVMHPTIMALARKRLQQQLADLPHANP